ncbi:MAG TPA: sugar phosphate isomerase/epimerase family protein [Bryobacteraceae bacterium]
MTSYPFRAFIESPTNRDIDAHKRAMDLKDFPAFVVEEFGVYNINPLTSHFRSTDARYLDEFREAVSKAGSHMVDLGLGGRPFYDPDEAKRKDAVAYGKQGIDIAVVVQSPSVRQHVSGRKGLKPDVVLAAESLGQLAEYGSKRNIIVNLENDSPVAEDPFFLVEVIERVNSPYLRALPDFGNSLVGHDREFNERAVKAMFKHAYGIAHVKDTVRSHDGKVYSVDLESMFGIARADGYRGYFSMEYDTGSGDPVQGTKELVEKSLKYLT